MVTTTRAQGKISKTRPYHSGRNHQCVHCRRTFASSKGLGGHLGAVAACALHSRRLIHRSANFTTATDHQDSLSPHDWPSPDEDLSINQSMDHEPVLDPDFFATSREHTNEVYIETKLLDLINNANAPLYLYEEILKWASEANRLNYSFHPQRTTRQLQIKCLERLYGQSVAKPFQREVTLPVDSSSPLSKSMVQKVNVTCYNFSEQLSSLLSDPDLVQDLDLLDVNPDNPFGKFKSSTLSCFNSGQWYDMAYNQVISDPHTELFVPIILAIDEAKLKGKGHHGCCPVMMTTSLFGQKLRNTSTAW
jgi:hypothetical protein